MATSVRVLRLADDRNRKWLDVFVRLRTPYGRVMQTCEDVCCALSEQDLVRCLLGWAVARRRTAATMGGVCVCAGQGEKRGRCSEDSPSGLRSAALAAVSATLQYILHRPQFTVHSPYYSLSVTSSTYTAASQRIPAHPRPPAAAEAQALCISPPPVQTRAASCTPDAAPAHTIVTHSQFSCLRSIVYPSTRTSYHSSPRRRRYSLRRHPRSGTEAPRPGNRRS